MTNEFDKFLKPNPEPEEEHLFWKRFGWARMRDEADTNTDRIPDNFNVDFGCPKCGSVWGEFRAFGFIMPPVHNGTAVIYGSMPFIRPDPMAITGVPSHGVVRVGDDVRAARLVCLDGHIVDYDVPSGRKRVHEPYVGGAPWVVMAGVMALGMMAYAYGLGKK